MANEKQRARWRAKQKRREQLLGMAQGTARARLVKGLLRELLRLRHDSLCYRCGLKILRTEDFHLDHKKAWETARNPLASYLDPTNVAFSHNECNVKAGAYANNRRANAVRRVDTRKNTFLILAGQLPGRYVGQRRNLGRVKPMKLRLAHMLDDNTYSVLNNGTVMADNLDLEAARRLIDYLQDGKGAKPTRARKKQAVEFAFDDIYQRYPRREGRQAGIQALTRTIKTGEQFAALSKAVDRYAAHCERASVETRFQLLFSTFANGRWQDWAGTPPTQTTAASTEQTVLTPDDMDMVF